MRQIARAQSPGPPGPPGPIVGCAPVRRSWDLIIIGGGIAGASVAFHVLRRAPWRVLLLEAAADLGTGATSKATGGIRHQFGTEINVRLTQLSYPYFEHAEEMVGRSVDFLRHGYLFVTTDRARLGEYQAGVALQQRLGVRSRTIRPDEMTALLPPLWTEDLLGGTFCPDDGSADPHGLLQGFVGQARERGLEARVGEPVVGFLRAGDRVTGVVTPVERYAAERVLVAAGPYSADVGALAGVEIPCRPFRRQVLVVEPLPELPDEFPLTVDGDTEWYVHRQGRSAVLLGGTDKNSHPGTDTEVDWPAFEAVMRAASHRVPILERAPVMRAYAGTRELSPDYSGIIGPVPQAPGLWVACGFSGHGFMHAPAIGIVMAELLLDGVASSVDATPLLYERFLRGNIRVEANIF